MLFDPPQALFATGYRGCRRPKRKATRSTSMGIASDRTPSPPAPRKFGLRAPGTIRPGGARPPELRWEPAEPGQESPPQRLEFVSRGLKSPRLRLESQSFGQESVWLILEFSPPRLEFVSRRLESPELKLEFSSRGLESLESILEFLPRKLEFRGPIHLFC